MKINRPFLGFIIVVAAVIVVMLWLGGKKPVAVTTNPIGPTVLPSGAITTQALTPKSVQTNSVPPKIAMNMPLPSEPNKGEQMKEGLSQMNDVPIVFYGRLEDQSDAPVAGAQIRANIRIYNGSGSTTEHLTTMSDGNGMFQINGGKGESLGIMPTKQGYALATSGTLFKYSYMYPDHFSPDQNNPTVIKMWKLQGAEPLDEINRTYRLPYTVAPINFDLVAGQIVPSGGDLTITVNRPTGIISQQHPQNWSIDLVVVGGGYIETSPEEAAITYAAPGGFYQPSGTFGNNNGPDLVDEMFFIQSRNGQVFSKIRLLFGINATPERDMTITISGVANTHGSRNWEATAPQ